jgi:nucleoside-diphosphate-sugar epimerase
VVLLGASGFLGSALLAQLAERPVTLRAVARRPAALPPSGAGRTQIRTADLTDRDALASVVADADAVIHLVTHRDSKGSWRTQDGDPVAERVNVAVLTDLIEILAERRATPDGRLPVVLFASTASLDETLGKPVPAPARTAPSPAAPTGYERQKLSAEIALRAATTAGVVHGVALRLPTVFGAATGPDAPDRGVVSAMARRALAGQPLTLWSDGMAVAQTPRRNLLYVADAARAFLAALDHAPRLAGRAWTIGADESTELGEVFRTVAALVAEHTGQPAVPVHCVAPPEGAATGADFRDVHVDSAPFRAMTGWRPGTGTRTALERTVKALAAEHGAPAPTHTTRSALGKDDRP